ncbi:unnamed protein product, partial [Mesorhabditis belari]|uniref:Uncharacterized protein n=1 Tax=Mesorhabditis belari TaxID=2138241 RepID=A0AAF3J7T2_9BILA
MIFGTQCTNHVANATDDFIWANVSKDQKTSYELQASIQLPFGEVEYRTNGTDESAPDRRAQFTRIEAGSYLAFRTNGCAQVKYVAVYRFVDGTLEWIASGHPIACDESVIATKNGGMQISEMGSIWKDIAGKVHKSSV